MKPSGIAYPPARRSTDFEVFHQTKIADPYRWLGKTSRETSTWIAAQSTLTAKCLARLEVRGVVGELLRSFSHNDSPAYVCSRGEFEFSFVGGSEGSGMLVRTRANGDCTTFDPSAVPALQGLRLQSGFCYVSPRGRFVVAGLARPGTDWMTLHLWDFDDNRSLPIVIPETVHPVVAWSADDTGFFYNLTRSQFGLKGFADGVYRHDLDGLVARDRRVFEHSNLEGHAALPVLAEETGFLLIKTLDFVTQRAGLFAVSLKDHPEPRRLLSPEATFNVFGHCEGDIVLGTTLDAPNGRVLALDPHSRRSREIVSEQRDAYLALTSHASSGVLGAVMHGTLFATYTCRASHTVRFFELVGRARGNVVLPSLCTVTRLAPLGDAVEILLSTFSSPARRFTVDTSGRANEIAGNQAPLPPCDTRQIWATSTDGTRVPAFVVTPQAQEGRLPTLLYGYGGWGQSLTPSFRTDLAVWLSLGGAYVVANIRGGREFGEAWYEGGLSLNKTNSFDDFCAVADELMRQGITSPLQLAIRGLSNGGLLVTACVNRRPELFAAASARTPLVDVLHLRALPAGDAIARELGDPRADAEAFRAMCAYSPLQNVRASARRPAVLVIVADRDDRVPREWAFRYIAAMQATCVGDQRVLLRLVENEGHVGWPAEVERDVMTDELAFLWSTVCPERAAHA